MMKKIIHSVLIAAASLTALSCDKGNETGGNPILVAAEIASEAVSITVDMNSYTPIDLIWTSGSWDGNGRISYRAVIDRENGDFSDPLLEIIPAEGTLSVFVTKAQIDQIWNAVAETEETETATVKWAVETTAGETSRLSSSQDIIMNKPYIAPQPVEFEVGMPLYVSGEGAAEAGQEMCCIFGHPFVTGGNYLDGQGKNMPVDYEIFTKIEAGKPFFLAYGDTYGNPDGYLSFSGIEPGTPGSYECLTEIPLNGLIVDKTSIYRIRINTTDSQILVQAVGEVGIRCFGREPGDKQTVQTNLPMTYTGKGAWTITGFDVKWGNTYANRYDTYKFYVKIDNTDQLYGIMDDALSANNPTKDTDLKYWGCRTVKGGAKTDAGAFRLPMWLISETTNPAYSADVTLHLDFSNGEYYYHEFTNEKAL